MAFPFYLAQTWGEFSACSIAPQPMAWMACHFSSYGSGLSNLPPALPPGSMVILNDRIPIHGHDPARITDQLHTLIERTQAVCVLLDLQRPDEPEASGIAAALVASLPCPVGVAESYAAPLNCPVFLSPPPPHALPEAWLAPWQGREIWLDAACTGSLIRVTEAGSLFLPPEEENDFPFEDQQLLCHYRTQIKDKEIRFHLRRTEADLKKLLQKAETLGVTRSVGLYQELGAFDPFN